MISADDYIRKHDLITGFLFIGTSLSALPIWYAMTFLFNGSNLLSVLNSADWLLPRLEAESARLRMQSHTAFLEGPYYLAHLLCVLALIAYQWRMLHQTASGIDFSNPLKWRLQPELVFLQVAAAIATILIIVFYTGFGTDNTRLARGIMGSPLVLVWLGIYFAALSGIHTNIVCALKTRALERRAAVKEGVEQQ